MRPRVFTPVGVGVLWEILGDTVLVEFDYSYLVSFPLKDVQFEDCADLAGCA